MYSPATGAMSVAVASHLRFQHCDPCGASIPIYAGLFGGVAGMGGDPPLPYGDPAVGGYIGIVVDFYSSTAFSIRYSLISFSGTSSFI